MAKLRIFVSGKEGELDDERATAREVITLLGFEPVDSHGRPAEDRSVEEAYPDEVRSSNIYLGIFGRCHSEPSVKEFEIARSNQIPPLVFEKDLRYKDKRDEELDSFLDRIKQIESGIVVKKYSNVTDLRPQLIESISNLLTKRFLKSVELEKQNQDLKSKSMDFKNNLEKPGRFFGVQYAEDYGRAQFVQFRFPDKVVRGETPEITTTVRGNTKNGFLDLAIVDPDFKWYWFPDPGSWDSTLDNGKLELTNGSYSNTWKIPISKEMKLGKYVALLGLYENNFQKRRCIHYVEKEFELTDT